MSGAIWLASYPRSGNTWTRIALYSLRNGGKEIDFDAVSQFGRMTSRRERVDRVLDVDTGLLTPAEQEELRPDANAALFSHQYEPELCKVHDSWILTPSGRPVFDKAFTHRSIYLVRDPRDVAVSWAKFANWPVELSVDFLCSHKASLGTPPSVGIGPQLTQRLGSWSDHVRSWIDESRLDPLVIRYEDMLADPANALCRMAAHIGWDAPEDVVARAIDATRFDQLAAKERREGFMERSSKAERFFQSGKSGTWRAVLSAKQAAKLESTHAAIMKRFGYF